MKQVVILLVLSIVAVFADAQDRDQRIADLEKQLAEAKSSIAVLQKTVDSLSTDILALHRPEKGPATDVTTGAKEDGAGNPDAAQDFTARIIGVENGSNEHDSDLNTKPEIFIQTRYSVAPVEGSGAAFNPNLRLSRIETRWAGKINERLGLALRSSFKSPLREARKNSLMTPFWNTT